MQADRPLLSSEAKDAEEGTSAGLDGESRPKGALLQPCRPATRAQPMHGRSRGQDSAASCSAGTCRDEQCYSNFAALHSAAAQRAYYVAAAAYTAKTKEDEEASELCTYSYSFFHLVFALASQYIAMLMTGWGTNPQASHALVSRRLLTARLAAHFRCLQERDLIDVGWASVWVKLATQWVTAAVYIWMLVAPTVFPDREWAS